MWTLARQPAVRHLAAAVGGFALAVAAAAAAPSSPVLPGPETIAAQAAAVAVLAAAFGLGYALPRPSLYLLVVVTLLEGAFRKWVANDIVVFLVKDFLAIGIYAAVLPTLERREWKRSPWVLVPLVGLLALAVVYVLRSPTFLQGLIGLRAYAMYVPLLWVAPKLLDNGRRLTSFLMLLLGAGLLESILAALQTLTGDSGLNQTAPGVRPALIVVDGISYLRPTGTMLQAGTLAAFMLFPVLVAFTLVMRYRRGWGLAAGLAALSVLSWGVIYSGSRALFATIVPSALVLLLYLAWRRRFLSLLAVPAALLVGFLAISYQPFVGGPGREGNDSHFLRNETFTWVLPDGTIAKQTISLGRGDPKATGGFVQRASGKEGPGTNVADRPRNRVQAQLDLLFDQGLLGHGTGAISLGSQYLLPEREEGAESQYVKVAYELGWPALVLFVWLLVALVVSAAWSSFVALPWRGATAALALGAVTFVPLLTLLTYAFDYPIVAMLFWTLAGCATAWTSPVREPSPIPTARAAPREAPSAPPTPARA